MPTTLWEFALKIYSADGVEQACLSIQDRHGADVNMVLFALWEGAIRGRVLTHYEVAEIHTSTEEWRQLVIRPLRKIRQEIKSAATHDPNIEKFRNQVKALELAGERLELEQVEFLASSAAHNFEAPSSTLARRNADLVLRTVYQVESRVIGAELDTFQAAIERSKN